MTFVRDEQVNFENFALEIRTSPAQTPRYLTTYMHLILGNLREHRIGRRN